MTNINIPLPYSVHSSVGRFAQEAQLYYDTR